MALVATLWISRPVAQRGQSVGLAVQPKMAAGGLAAAPLSSVEARSAVVEACTSFLRWGGKWPAGLALLAAEPSQ